jgi:hypothetical protein
MNDLTASRDSSAAQGHEYTDVSAWGILLFIGGLAATIVVITGALWLLFDYLANRQAKIDRSRFPLAVADRQRPLEDRLPPAPRLEGLNPDSAFHSGVYGWPSLGPAQRERDEAELGRYGWADAKAGIAQIPIDRAIAILAGKLPVRKEAEKAEGARPVKEAERIEKQEGTP